MCDFTMVIFIDVEKKKEKVVAPHTQKMNEWVDVVSLGYTHLANIIR